MQSVIPNAKKAPQCLLVGFHRTSILVRVFVRTETKIPSWYNDKDRNRPGGNYSALFPLFEEKGGCGRLGFF